jgi:hypothetical protein
MHQALVQCDANTAEIFTHKKALKCGTNQSEILQTLVCTEGQRVESDHKLILKVAILKCELCLYPLTPVQNPNVTPTNRHHNQRGCL